MVAKTAGSFLGGILNNPGAVILGGIVIALLFFSGDIRKAFGSFGESFGKIELPDINLPEINFPEIKFPEFNFPDINIDFPEFPEVKFPDFSQFFKGEPSVDPERMDVPFDVPGREDLPPIDIVPGFGRDDPRRPTPDIRPFPMPKLPTVEEIAPDFPLNISDFINRFTGRGITAQVQARPFAVENVEETQAQFQERAAAFVEVLPEVTAFTSLPGAATDFIRPQLSRNQEDFEDVLAAEARRSRTIFAGLFGNVQNPDF